MSGLVKLPLSNQFIRVKGLTDQFIRVKVLLHLLLPSPKLSRVFGYFCSEQGYSTRDLIRNIYSPNKYLYNENICN